MTTFYVTKYALTDGIQVVEVNDPPRSDYLHGYLANGRRFDAFGNEFHRTLQDAQIDAERRKAKRLASLRKSIVKLELLKIKIVGAST